MRRVIVWLMVFGLVATACGGTDDAGSTSARPTTTEAAATTTTTSLSDAGDPADEWDPAVAEQLTALEAANNGEWTVETALEAVGLLRGVFREGVEQEPPIGVPRLIQFLADNFAEIPDADWDETLASGVNGQLIAYQPSPQRDVYQDFAERMNAEFEGLTGHVLEEPIYLALSDLAVPFDVYAATWVGGTNLRSFQFLFGDMDVWQQMVDDVSALVTDPTKNGAVCIILLGTALTGWSEERQLSGLLHEVAHCHQQSIHPRGPLGFSSTPAKWMDEGYASWAGEVFFGGTSTSRRWWDAYLRGGVGSPPDGFTLFDGSYKAIGFYSMLASAGVNPWAEFVRWFGGLRDGGVSNFARYEGMASGANQQVVAGWTASSSRNNDFGPPWNSDNGPGIQNSSQSRRANDARASEERTFTADPGEQRYWAVQFNTEPDTTSVISIEAVGLGTYRWDHADWKEQYTVVDTLSQVWCVGEECVCEDGTMPVPGAVIAPIGAGDRPVLHSALFGGGGGAQLTVSLRTLEDLCEEEEPTGPLDACLFGTWNPDPEQFQDLVLTLYRGIPGLTIVELVGTIDLTFDDEGNFQHTYNGVRGTGIYDGETYTATWSGGTFGTWEASGGVLTLNFTGSDIVATVGPISGIAPPIPSSSVDAAYTCGSTTLEVVPPATPGDLWPLPEDWSKVG